MSKIKSILTFFIPGSLFFVTAIILISTRVVPDKFPGLITIYPFFVLLAGIVLGVRFDRSRLVFIILILALADRTMSSFSTVNLQIAQNRDIFIIVTNFLAILIPINFTALLVLKERGIISFSSLLRIFAIVLQIGFVYICCTFHESVSSVFKVSFFKFLSIEQIAIGRIALLISCVSICFLIFEYVKSQGTLESGFFWALLMALLPLLTGKAGVIATFYFSTSALILIVSLIELSYRLAFVDELTGLPSKRSLNESLLNLRSSYTIDMIDIDKFKNINDRFGHDIGDQVLKMVASKLPAGGGGSKVFRYGGEEFTLIYPGKKLKEALPLLEELKTTIAEADFVIRARRRKSAKWRFFYKKKRKSRSKRIKITVSIGAAQSNKKINTPDAVIRSADKALYKAKKAGRNRVVSN